MFLWYTETVFSWYIQSLVPKCAYFISLSNGNTFRSLTIPKRKWYLWGSKSVCICYHFNTLLLMKVEKKNFVFIYCTEQLNLKNISYWYYFTTKIMSICPIWNFTLYVTIVDRYSDGNDQGPHIWLTISKYLNREFWIHFNCHKCFNNITNIFKTILLG